MLKSYETLSEAGIMYKDAPLYIPPYEYYNKKIAAWAKAMGIQLINFTPGSGSNADYTTPDMKNYKSSKMIYKRIRDLREDNDMTQAQVGEKINVPQRTYAYYETGERMIPPHVLWALADLYDVSIDYLLGRTDDKKR